MPQHYAAYTTPSLHARCKLVARAVNIHSTQNEVGLPVRWSAKISTCSYRVRQGFYLLVPRSRQPGTGTANMPGPFRMVELSRHAWQAPQRAPRLPGRCRPDPMAPRRLFRRAAPPRPYFSACGPSAASAAARARADANRSGMGRTSVNWRSTSSVTFARAAWCSATSACSTCAPWRPARASARPAQPGPARTRARRRGRAGARHDELVST